MTRRRQLPTATFTALAVLACLGTKADAAQCGATRRPGFEVPGSDSSRKRRGQKASAPPPCQP